VGSCEVDHGRAATTSRARNIASIRIAISGRLESSRVKFGPGSVTTALRPCNNGEHLFADGDHLTPESLISLASRTAELFERSKTEQKRQLIAFVFSNLQLRGKKLEFSLRSPFDLMVESRILYKLARLPGFSSNRAF
jgi:hypothetical protein